LPESTGPNETRGSERLAAGTHIYVVYLGTSNVAYLGTVLPCYLVLGLVGVLGFEEQLHGWIPLRHTLDFAI